MLRYHSALTALLFFFAVLVSCIPSLNAFVCDNGTLSIADERVNDDYCDCADGADERMTNACPTARFICVNNGFLRRTIPSAFIDDGVCDCCDGSDERAHVNDVRCPQTCLD